MHRRLLVVAAGALAPVLACSDGGSTESFCATAGSVAADNPPAAFGAYDPSDPVAGDEDLQRAAAQLRRLADDAPEEIRGDADRLADVGERLVEILGDDDPEAVRQGLRDLDPEAGADLDGASRRVTDFTRTECGIELDPAGSATSTTSTTATTAP